MVKKVWLPLIITLSLIILLLVSGCAGGSAIAKDGDTVKIHYTGTLEDGTVFDTSEGVEPLEFTLGVGSMIPGFEQAVYGMKIGQSKTVAIPADEAYGLHNDDLLIVLNRDQLPAGSDPEVGQVLQLQTEDGRILTATITEVFVEAIIVDANHPLAGKDLIFEIELVEIN